MVSFIRRITLYSGVLTIMLSSCGSKDSDRIGERMAPSVNGSDDAIPDPNSVADPEEIVDDDNEVVDVPPSDDAEYRKILQSCGGIDPTKPNELMLDQPLKAIPARQTGTETIVLLPVHYTVDFNGDLLIQSSINKNDITRSLNLMSAQPSIAAGMARDRLAAKSGMLIADYLPYAERGSLADKDPVWDGITCTVQPAWRTTNTVAKRVVATYDKPLPIHVSPIAYRERYEIELNRPRHWELSATIVQSENPSLKVGRVLHGTVDIEPVANQKSVTLPDGRVVIVMSDTGVRIRILFETDAITNMMGLTPDSTYLLDHTTRKFHSISADLKDGESPVVTFVTPEALP